MTVKNFACDRRLVRMERCVQITKSAYICQKYVPKRSYIHRTLDVESRPTTLLPNDFDKPQQPIAYLVELKELPRSFKWTECISNIRALQSKRIDAATEDLRGSIVPDAMAIG